MADVLTYTLEGTTAVLQMDDGKANALSEAMIEQVVAALGRAEKEAQAIVLVGRPERFCAGFDLKVMMSSPDAAKALLRKGADMLMKLYGTPLPLVIACTGHALAGGALVLLTGDYRIGTAGAYRIGLNEVQIGMPVPILAMELARARIAPIKLVKTTLHAHVYDPEEGAKVGYLDEVVAADQVLARAKEEAAKLGQLSRMAYGATKSRLRGNTIKYIVDTLDDDMKNISTGV